MREIKFRVYIKKTKETLPVVSIVQMNDEEGLRVFPQGYDRNFLESEGDIALMQYTGFKDKNGKEIYEGDVLYKDFQKSKKPNLIGDVDFENGSYIWKYKEEGNDIWYVRFLSDIGVSEVIGNIYENPELVKV